MRYQLTMLFVLMVSIPWAAALEPAATLNVWPDLAPGETERATGTLQPFRKGETPPVSRVVDIRLPTMDVFPASQPNGVGVLILPGGGFGKVVPDMEGSEAAAILNQHGITAFVLRYRTKQNAADVGWKKPLQDAQRGMCWLRQHADRWQLKNRPAGHSWFFRRRTGHRQAADRSWQAGIRQSRRRRQSVTSTRLRDPDLSVEYVRQGGR